jgi:hypothetical protein
MPAPQFIEGKPVIDYDEVYTQSVTITAGTNDTRQSKITTRRGLRAFIIRVSQAWDAGLDPNVTWRILVNKVARYPWEGSTVQISAPEQDAWAVPKEVPEATDVEFSFDVGGAVNGKVTTRLGIAYIEKS